MGGAVAKVFRPPTPSRPPPAPIMVAPTVAEVSQSEATSADGYDARKTKKKEDHLQSLQDQKVFKMKQ